MAEVGQVIEVVNEKRLVIKLSRQEACGKCKACTVGLQEKDMLLEAENLCEAKLDDFVEIYLEKSSFLKAVLIMYTIPLLAFLLGLLIGYLLTKNELIIFGVGLAFMAIVFIAIRANEHRFNSAEYRPMAVKIVEVEQ